MNVGGCLNFTSLLTSPQIFSQAPLDSSTIFKLSSLAHQEPTFSSNTTRSKTMTTATHRADATALLDERGYSGPLVRGGNPAHLIEKAVRDRITSSLYWLEQCYGLNAATLCDRAAELTAVGGTYGGVGKPTPFLCLAFKMLQLVPERDVILAYLNWRDDEYEKEEEDGEEVKKEEKETGDVVNGSNGRDGEFKYLRALAAFYIRLTWEPVEIYKTLEPLLADMRKLKRRTREGYALTYVDQFVDDLLTKDRICATSLWKLPSRTMLEDLDLLEPRESPLGEELEELEREQEEKMDESEEGQYTSDDGDDRSRDRSYSRSQSRSRTPSRSRSRSRTPRSRSRSRRSDYSED
ncbi:PRP38-domain-containing protein [Microthyrium microscopicum]|uniref:Pre-mRNA-splicing factor 38 n=1 Tax=Microthyrium microscopicum TaxID=703497 RepID=A0A6A6URP0_9PEZI|nr:PRP38-domain-containing protein [Microthyrium microscopicum]